MPPITPYPWNSATGSADSSPPSDDGCADLRRMLDEAIRSAKELRQSGERARRENDPELCTFFECCALSDEARAVEVRELLASRTLLPASENPTSAAFAAGDGADDADVSPDSRRGRVGIWPAL
ncbi:MAG TPA: hypothetical protein VER11_09495 [Polyangiaceae bacterium]|nr:hypothetical protein [Polyangiaceae bacterium]